MLTNISGSLGGTTKANQRFANNAMTVQWAVTVNLIILYASHAFLSRDLNKDLLLLYLPDQLRKQSFKFVRSSRVGRKEGEFFLFSSQLYPARLQGSKCIEIPEFRHENCPSNSFVFSEPSG